VVNLSAPGAGVVDPDVLDTDDEALGRLLEGWLDVQAVNAATGAATRTVATVTGLIMTPQ
jgi:hypothetical protein